MGLIYKATNKINGKSYIGQTSTSLEERKIGHLKASQLQYPKTYFHKAIKKYGFKSFKWIILERNENNLDLAEQWFIRKLDTYKNGYNLTTGGEGGYIRSDKTKKLLSKAASERTGKRNNFYGKGHLVEGEKNHFYGKHHSEETKKIIKQKKIGKKIHSIEWKNELSKKMSGSGNRFYGKKHSEETKEKIRLSHIGKKHSEETKKRMSEAHKRRKMLCPGT